MLQINLNKHYTERAYGFNLSLLFLIRLLQLNSSRNNYNNNNISLASKTFSRHVAPRLYQSRDFVWKQSRGTQISPYCCALY